MVTQPVRAIDSFLEELKNKEPSKPGEDLFSFGGKVGLNIQRQAISKPLY